MACIGVEDGIGLEQVGQFLMVRCGCVGMLWAAMEGQQGIKLSYGGWAYREKSDGVDGQLIDVGVTHDCDGNWNAEVQLRFWGGCCCERERERGRDGGEKINPKP